MFKKTLAICIKELYMLFLSPMAYILCGGFLFLYGYFFFSGTLLANITDMSEVMGNITIAVFMLNPLISMRLLSEEKKNGTLELLLSSPVSIFSIVFGKFLASVILFFLVLLLTLTGPLYLEILASVYWPVVWMQYLGMFLMGVSILGIGLVYSAITENQMIAGVMSMVTGLGLFLLSWISGSTSGVIRQIIDEVTILSHYSSFNRGIFDLKDIVYYLLWITFCILLARKFTEDARWRR